MARMSEEFETIFRKVYGETTFQRSLAVLLREMGEVTLRLANNPAKMQLFGSNLILYSEPLSAAIVKNTERGNHHELLPPSYFEASDKMKELVAAAVL